LGRLGVNGSRAEARPKKNSQKWKSLHLYLRSRVRRCRRPTPCGIALRSSGTARTACLRVHPDRFPMMPREVVEAPAVHEAVVLRIHGVLSASGDRLANDLVDLRPVVA